MLTKLHPVTLENRGELDDITLDEYQRSWVHASWYWHQQSIENPNILFRLIYIESIESAVGMVAFGQAYSDEELTIPISGSYEIIHLVVDHRYQKQGIGKLVARSIIHMLAANPDCERVLVAHHPENKVSRLLFIKFGFQPIPLRNYDGDPMLELSRNLIKQQP
jgi:RimJ/RimL family protein N-acetyltransferase